MENSENILEFIANVKCRLTTKQQNPEHLAMGSVASIQYLGSDPDIASLSPPLTPPPHSYLQLPSWSRVIQGWLLLIFNFAMCDSKPA